MARAMVTITQRSRGIFLCNGSEDEHGTEDWEAVGTLAKAKRWGANYLGVKRPKWTARRLRDHWPIWWAEHEYESDGERELRELAEAEGF
jgi:hypothetical protein